MISKNISKRCGLKQYLNLPAQAEHESPRRVTNVCAKREHPYHAESAKSNVESDGKGRREMAVPLFLFETTSLPCHNLSRRNNLHAIPDPGPHKSIMHNRDAVE